ncbi:unnamed protein product [Tetraodon nigroviridis]|uniref:Chromosome 11 SCAF15043, whole genome shotgun sequence n=1 Tax=Tetraodon nigroviridis TaxID=99883 RepID=Q4RIG2_TETNG|nr:unnamed protein product [Tetraodon nigroviridis]
MAASSAQRTYRPCNLLALALMASFLNGVNAQGEEATTMMTPSQVPEANVRGDMVPQSPDHAPLELTTQATVAPKESGDHGDHAAPEKAAEFTSEAQTNLPNIPEAETLTAEPPRGDGPANRAQENTRAKLQSVLQDLCGEDCKLEIFQEDKSDEIIVSGNYVEADVSGMTSKFNNDNIKDKTGVENAVTRWRQKSKLVLVSLLLTGLLLAALLVAGYYLKTHRRSSKGVRLAESFQVDEENQANTLVSVAPLPQEPLDKPTVNRESPPENGTSPTTNGHSAEYSAFLAPFEIGYNVEGMSSPLMASRWRREADNQSDSALSSRRLSTAAPGAHIYACSGVCLST